MKTKDKQQIKSWSCPKCGRTFTRRNQSHSCKTYPLKQHFSGNEKCKMLFDKLRDKITSDIGPFKIDSIACCIHLVNQSTFSAVRVMKNKLRVDFTLDYMLSGNRIGKSLQMSKHCYLYYVDISEAGEIDAELLKWLKDAYNRKKTK